MGKERILFVDDEEMLAHVGQKLLTHLGYDAVACTSSLDALETFVLLPSVLTWSSRIKRCLP